MRTAEDVSDNSEPILYLTDAFRETYGNQVVHCDCSFWVRAEPEDVAAVSAALPSAFGDYRLVVQPVDSSLSARVEDAVGLEVGALRIAALIGTLALSAGRRPGDRTSYRSGARRQLGAGRARCPAS